MNLRWVAFTLLGLMTTVAHPQSGPICVTHFYNVSNFQWSIYNADGKRSAIFIPPQSTVMIAWGPTNVVTLHGDLGSKSFTQQYTVTQANSCVMIQAPAPSAQVTVNKPGNGDITTCAGGC